MNNVSIFLKYLLDRDISKAKEIVLGGTDINQVDKHGSTMLMTAAMLDSPNMVKFLLEHGASVDIRTLSGATVFDLVMHRYQMGTHRQELGLDNLLDIVKLLILYGASEWIYLCHRDICAYFSSIIIASNEDDSNTCVHPASIRVSS